MTPTEVLDRFTEEEMIRMVAYQNLYGPIGPKRSDLLLARLGMDVVSPHLKKGHKPQIKDHMIEWDRRTRHRKTPEEMLQAVKGFQKEFERADS